ncbi:MAG: hypothetical protein II304_09770 [Bacteroidales bacterium]|nr:hypothetical protein [Bacteroidales bacterium]
MNDKKKVCVVHIETRRFFDECQSSFLPVMYPIFGVYSTREEAEHAVWDYFTNRFKEKYEVCCDNFDAEGNGLYFDLCFKREDKTFKGCAFYGVNFYCETIDA